MSCCAENPCCASGSASSPIHLKQGSGGLGFGVGLQIVFALFGPSFSEKKEQPKFESLTMSEVQYRILGTSRSEKCRKRVPRFDGKQRNPNWALAKEPKLGSGSQTGFLLPAKRPSIGPVIV